jgi:hypothetical protein
MAAAIDPKTALPAPFRTRKIEFQTPEFQTPERRRELTNWMTS